MLAVAERYCKRVKAAEARRGVRGGRGRERDGDELVLDVPGEAELAGGVELEEDDALVGGEGTGVDRDAQVRDGGRVRGGPGR